MLKNKNVLVEENEGCTTIRAKGLHIQIENGHLTINSELPMTLKGSSLKKLATLQSGMINLVLEHLEK